MSVEEGLECRCEKFRRRSVQKLRKKAAEHDMQGELACFLSKESCAATFAACADESNSDLGIGASLVRVSEASFVRLMLVVAQLCLWKIEIWCVWLEMTGRK